MCVQGTFIGGNQQWLWFSKVDADARKMRLLAANLIVCCAIAGARSLACNRGSDWQNFAPPISLGAQRTKPDRSRALTIVLNCPRLLRCYYRRMPLVEVRDL